MILLFVMSLNIQQILDQSATPSSTVQTFSESGRAGLFSGIQTFQLFQKKPLMMKRKLEPSNSKAKDEKVNDEKATMKKVPLKADLIIQLKDLQDNFNNLQAINFKNLETIRDLQAKVEALEKEKCETLRQTKQTQAETVS